MTYCTKNKYENEKESVSSVYRCDERLISNNRGKRCFKGGNQNRPPPALHHPPYHPSKGWYGGWCSLRLPPKRQTLTNTLQFDQVSESQTVALATVYNACSSMYHSYHPTWGDEKNVLNKLCWTCHGRFFNIKVVTEEYYQSTNQNAITCARSAGHFENQLSSPPILPPAHFLYFTIPNH